MYEFTFNRPHDSGWVDLVNSYTYVQFSKRSMWFEFRFRSTGAGHQVGWSNVNKYLKMAAAIIKRQVEVNGCSMIV